MPHISKNIDAYRILSILVVLSLIACAGTRPGQPAAITKPAPIEPTPTEPTKQEPAVILEPQLHAYVESLLPSLATIPAERREVLERIAAFVREHRAAGQPAKLVFICTHNSRRSHMSQLWATVAAAWYGIDGVEAYSGGTEATAFNPRAVAAMARAGFTITAPAPSEANPSEANPSKSNPRYQITYAADRPAITAYSKTYDDGDNPGTDFAAIMNCSEADQACPFVKGAALRISLSYDDPKQADATPEENARYDERARQIATEMFYLFSRVEG
jgi:arsenate reductase